MPRLGLIILDEEHEWTYKQTEPAPRYHAREVALKLARADRVGGGPGQRHARRGELLPRQPRRLPVCWSCRTGCRTRSLPGPAEAPAAPRTGRQGTCRLGVGMPPVEVVDLRAELQAGNRCIFSRSLHEAMTVALAAGQQVILFLNRRGTSTFIMCRDCGHVLTCKQCEVPFSYHEVEDDLVCHRCGRRALVPDICPQCWSKRIKFLGIGTQKVEDEVRRAFPEGPGAALGPRRDRRQGAPTRQILETLRQPPGRRAGGHPDDRQGAGPAAGDPGGRGLRRRDACTCPTSAAPSAPSSC